LIDLAKLLVLRWIYTLICRVGAFWNLTRRPLLGADGTFFVKSSSHRSPIGKQVLSLINHI
jgi:hypothetical protein